MDRPISTSEKRASRLANFGKIALAVIALIAVFLVFKNLLKTKIEKTDFRFATVERGDIENVITATGLIVPAFEQQINSPINTEIKKVHLKSGAHVKAGAVILELHDAFIRLDYETRQDELELKKNNVTRLKYEYDKNLKELDYDDQIKGLEVASLEANLADMKRLRGIGGATGEEVERAELNLKIAKLQKKKLENDLDFRKKAITADRRNLELEVMMQEKKLLELQRKLTQTTVTAPRAGVLTWINESIGKQVNEGDPLARLADLAAFRVEASCSDRYASLVKVGMSVKVRINKTNLLGTINAILPAVENNTIRFVVNLEAANSDLLRPNMRVEVFIISDKKENVLRVQNGAAFSGGIQQEVFVVRGDQAVKVPVRVGLTNLEFVEISSDQIKAGDQIMISDMKDYLHLNVIELKEKSK